MTTATPTLAAATYLEARLDGVDIAGIQWFEIAEPGGHPATKWDYRPNYDAINDNLDCLSTGEAAFLAAMYSFFNPHVGGRMMKRLGVDAPGQLAAILDAPRLRVIAELMTSYEGW